MNNYSKHSMTSFSFGVAFFIFPFHFYKFIKMKREYEVNGMYILTVFSNSNTGLSLEFRKKWNVPSSF